MMSFPHFLQLAFSQRIIHVERLMSQFKIGGFMSMRTRGSVIGMTLALLLPLTAAAFAQGAPTGPRQARQRRKAAFFLNEKVQMDLGLTADQQEKLRQLRRKMTVAGIESRSQVQIKQLELQDLMAAKSLDRAAIDKKVQEISALRGAQMKNMIDMRFGLQGILTPEQMDKIKEMRGHAIRQRIGHQRAMRNPEARPAKAAKALKRQKRNATRPPVQPPAPPVPPNI
jgi:Spy/CpxP family protein refolding chaperone